MSIDLDRSVVESRSPASLARYRAKVAFVSPLSRRISFESEQECFLGVSLENRNFETPRFHALLEWVSRRFPRCKILVGDSIHRITLETRAGTSPDAALPEALQLGRDFIEAHRGLIATYRGFTNFEFVTCAEIQATASYARFHGAIRKYFEAVPAFRKSVQSFGLHYHRSDWEDIPPDEQAYRLRRSCEYFLEEFSVFACLVEAGNSVMVYPGSFSTLAEVADGLFPGISPEFQALTVVSIQLKKR